MVWSVPDSDGGLPVVGYEIRSSYKNGRRWTRWVSRGQQTYARVSGLRRGTKVTFQVRAVNAAGTSPAASVRVKV